MPKTTAQRIYFTLFMTLIMVSAMIAYNVALTKGAVSAEVLLAIPHEILIMWPIAFAIEFFFVDAIAHKIAFSHVKPTDSPLIITFSITFPIICIMCPVMSLIATLLFKENSASTWFFNWILTAAFNMPMAFFWQLCYCGPLTRTLFRASLKLVERVKQND